MPLLRMHSRSARGSLGRLFTLPDPPQHSTPWTCKSPAGRNATSHDRSPQRQQGRPLLALRASVHFSVWYSLDECVFRLVLEVEVSRLFSPCLEVLIGQVGVSPI